MAAPTKKLSHDIGFFYFDEDLDLGDMGYLVTNNWAILAGQSKYKVNDFQADSINSQSRKALENNRTKTEIVKCKVCNLNIPQTEAIRVDGTWCCAKKHIH